MTEDKLDLVVQRLTTLLGSRHVRKEGPFVVAEPSSSGEISGIMEIARNEGIPVIHTKYSIGAADTAGAVKGIRMSLERMCGIAVDRQRQYLLAGPAAETALVIKAAAGEGFVFPGKECLQRGATIGENIIGCFAEGEPHFDCLEACLCGLEMVLADGRHVVVDGSGAKDIDNYHLSFLLAGCREHTAVITGIHLKLTYAKKYRCCLLAVGVDLAKTVETLPLLLESSPNSLREAVVLNNSFLTGVPEAWKDVLHFLREAGASIVFRIEGNFPDLEALLEGIVEHCGLVGPAEVLIAGDSYQREALSDALDLLIKYLIESPDIFREALPPPGAAFCPQDQLHRLAAINWRRQADRSGIFYVAGDLLQK